MKSVRTVLWIMVAVMAGFSSYLWLSKNQPVTQTTQTAVNIGGPFNLISHDGKPFTEAELKGRHHAIFFGFTHCPDICPATLLQAASWIKTLGPDSQDIDFYFFSVDPERDTAKIMKEYVSHFDPRITGVTGSPDEMVKTLKSYKVYAQRVDLEDDDYTMDHSAFVMLFRSDGGFQGTIASDETDETAVAKLRRLLENS